MPESTKGTARLTTATATAELYDWRTGQWTPTGDLNVARTDLDVFEKEPVRRLVTQGIVNGPDGRKMSKRWGNVVQPGPIVDRFGADTMRMFMLFAAPPEKDIDWSDEQVDGMFRFLARVWRLFVDENDQLRVGSALFGPRPPLSTLVR